MKESVFRKVLVISLMINICVIIGLVLCVTSADTRNYVKRIFSPLLPSTVQVSPPNSIQEDPVYLRPSYLRKTSQFDSLPIVGSQTVFIGDSITADCQWNELFPSYPVANRGIGGDTTLGVQNRISQVVINKPGKIFIMVGINDLILEGEPYIPELLANYRKIIATIQEKSPDTEIYIQSILPINREILQTGKVDNNSTLLLANKGLKKLAHERGVFYVDLFKALCDENNQLPTEYTIDGLHLNGQGYLQWKKQIEKYL